MYSHEGFCKFQKNNRKCLNRSCTHQHDLPHEIQLAQLFFNEIMQFSSLPDSFEAQNFTSERDLSVNFSTQSGTSAGRISQPENDIQGTRNLEIDSTIKAQSVFQHSKQAEPHYCIQFNLSTLSSNSFAPKQLFKVSQQFKWS